jgi:hypothetical protein
MPSKPIELPPEVAKAFVRDMRHQTILSALPGRR